MEKYIKKHQIGRGGFGKVLLIIDKETNKRYAMKIVLLTEGAVRDDRKGAQKEATALAKLKHPNIVTYIESFKENGNLHIVMAFCAEGDLFEKIEQKRMSGIGFKVVEIIDILRQLCDALEYIHYRRIIHRDIKPRNIFLADGLVKLGDFGLSKILNSSSDFATTHNIGTLQYTAPEIFSDQPYNSKCDMWSLGCVLYELSTLKRPFQATNPEALILQIINSVYTPLPKGVSLGLSFIIDHLIIKDQVKRLTARETLNKLNEQRTRLDEGNCSRQHDLKCAVCVARDLIRLSHEFEQTWLDKGKSVWQNIIESLQLFGDQHPFSDLG